eukprot:TRINITY_DN3922_c0_g2_i1.p1 TRINITY_DN3922_c0_g2~~TRINITY_DN3922_c0_g2_i1.p1  ORF type:complete len:786 (+),score=136.83 TRINITY_DN3922_c0_g2_i1:67-2424(+)
MSLLKRYMNYTAREDDDAIVRTRKEMYMVKYPAVLTGVCGVAALGGSDLLVHATFAYLGALALSYLHLMATKTFPMWALQFNIATTVMYISLMDINASASGTDRVWPLFVVLLDILLVCRVPKTQSKVLAIFVVVWLFFTAIEKAFRFGLFDFPGTRSYTSRGELYDCEELPCANLPLATMSFMTVTLVFLLDYYFTRGFADQVLEEKEKVEVAITTTQKVAASLAAFDLDTAEDELSEASLPAPLQLALSNIIGNLKLYRPFLPDALFDELHADSASPLRTHAVNVPPGSSTSRATLVFTDIQSSTATWEASPGGMKKALKKHNTIIRDQLDLCRGYEVKTIGDAFMAAFEDETGAAEFAFNVQRDLCKSSWPPELLELPQCAKVEGLWNGLRIRIGMHTGEVELELNSITGRFDYFGPTVNKASRIEAAAVGGGIAVSEEVMEVLKSTGMFSKANPPVTVALGDKVLKGVHGTSKLTLLIPYELAGRKLQIDQQLKYGQMAAFTSLNDRLSSSGSSRRDSRGDSQIGSSPQAFSVLTSKFENLGSVTVGKADLFKPDAEETSVDAAVGVNEDLCRILQYLERSGGTVLVLLGGALSVAWNVSRKCITHFESAMRWTNLSHKLRKKGLVLGIASGQVVSGTFGTANQRFLSSLGGCVTLCGVVTAAASEFGVFSVYGSFSVDPFFASFKADLKAFLRPMDTWFLSSTPTAPITIYEIAPLRFETEGFAAGGSKPAETGFHWSGKFWTAFTKKDWQTILDHSGNDAVAERIAMKLSEGGKRIVHC